MDPRDNQSKEPEHIPNLLPHHQRELAASGLTAATIRAAGIYSETKYHSLAAQLGWPKVNKNLV